MRIKKLCLFFLFIMLMAQQSFSASVANAPSFPEKNKFSFGIEFWKIDSRDIFEYDDLLDGELASDGYAARVSYGLTGNLALDFRFGQADFEWVHGTYAFDKGRMLGAGLRALLFQTDDGLRITSGFQYNDYSPENDFGGKGLEFETEVKESLLTVEISQELAERITLYGGMIYSNLTMKYFHDGKYGQREGGYEESDQVGIYTGADLRLFKGLSVFGEGHFSNQEAYVFGLMYKMTGENPAEGNETSGIIPEKTGSFSERIHVGAEISRMSERKMTEIGGFVPEFDLYRMTSDRMFLTLTFDLVERISVFTKLGRADLEAHSSEGETTEFDPEFAWVVGARGDLVKLDNGVTVSAEISYIQLEPESEETISTPKRMASTPGDLSIEWSQLDVCFEISKQIDKTRFFGGVRYSDITVDQERLFEDGTVLESSFESDKDFGIFAGVEYSVSKTFSLMFQADIVDVKGYTFGGLVNF